MNRGTLNNLSDALAIANLYLLSHMTFLPFAPLAHSDDEVRVWVEGVLCKSADIHLATKNDQLIGFLALKKDDPISWISHLYLHPNHVGQGIGTALMQVAKESLTPPIHLYCFQQNSGARRFYERHGFKAIKFGDGSENEENCPDVLYEWRPI